MRSAFRLRPLAALAAAGVAALTLAGCSGGGTEGPGPLVSIPSEDPTATVKVLTVFDLEADGLQSVIDEFEKAHPTKSTTPVFSGARKFKRPVNPPNP